MYKTCEYVIKQTVVLLWKIEENMELSRIHLAVQHFFLDNFLILFKAVLSQQVLESEYHPSTKDSNLVKSNF